MTPAKILIVEDEGLIAMDLEAQLQSLGYQVAGIVSSGEQAIACIDSCSLDLVLLDIRLKGRIDGIEAAKYFSIAQVPIIYLTSHTDEATIQRAKQTEPLGYLVKPFAARELHSAIQIALHRHHVEVRVRRREQWLRTAMHSIGDAVVATYPDGRVCFMNTMAEKLTGWDAKSAVGRPFEAVVQLEQAHADVAVAGAEGAPSETHLVARHGARIQIEDSAAPICTDDGRVIGGVMIFRDISERRRTEFERLQAMNALRRVNEDLEQFAYAASHDLREPLRNVSLSLQLLAKQFSGQLDSSAGEWIDLAVSSASRMRSMIDGLLLYSRTTSDSHEGAPEVDAGEALQTAMHNVQIWLEETSGVVKWSFLPRVAIRPYQLVSLFQNLLSNALKYRRQNVTPEIQIAAERNGEYWQFSVSDNGIGFSRDQAERVFGLFKRLHRDEYPGAGVGLAICKRVIDRSGGQIWAESEPGRGTTFYFTLLDAHQLS